MKIVYDSLGNLVSVYLASGQAAAKGTSAGQTGVYAIDEVPENQAVIDDITATAARRDQDGRGKYYVQGGVLTVRDGWKEFSPLFMSDPAYQTTDRAVALVNVQPKVLAQAALTDTQDPTRIAARCTARVLMSSLVEVRSAYNQLAAWARPLGYTGPTLVNRTFAQAILATQAVIGTESDPTQ